MSNNLDPGSWILDQGQGDQMNTYWSPHGILRGVIVMMRETGHEGGNEEKMFHQKIK